MKIVVIGGSGLIGKSSSNNLRQQGHEVVAASPSSGVNTLTGEGLAEALAGARSSSTWRTRRRSKTRPFMEFFETAGRNILAAEAAAGVRPSRGAVGRRHRSPAGERLLPREDGPGEPDQGRRRFPTRSSAQRSSSSSWAASPKSATDGQTVRLPPAMMQPIVSDDVAASWPKSPSAEPLNGTVDIAGPEPIPHGRTRPTILDARLPIRGR